MLRVCSLDRRETIIEPSDAPDIHAGALFFMDECSQNPQLDDLTYNLLNHTFHFSGENDTDSPFTHCTPRQLRLIARSLPSADKAWVATTAQTLYEAGSISEEIRNVVLGSVLAEPIACPLGGMALAEETMQIAFA